MLFNASQIKEPLDNGEKKGKTHMTCTAKHYSVIGFMHNTLQGKTVSMHNKSSKIYKFLSFHKKHSLHTVTVTSFPDERMVAVT